MIIPQRETPVRDILLFLGGTATGLLGALILLSEGSQGPVCELGCNSDGDKEDMTQPAGTESV